MLSCLLSLPCACVLYYAQAMVNTLRTRRRSRPPRRRGRLRDRLHGRLRGRLRGGLHMPPAVVWAFILSVLYEYE